MPSNAQESYEENKEFDYRESVAGSVIQATGTVEFEDGLWIGNQIMTRNGLQTFSNVLKTLTGSCTLKYSPQKTYQVGLLLFFQHF